MKHINIAKRKRSLLSFVAVVFLLFGITSCNKEEVAPNLVKFKGYLNGHNLVPVKGSANDKGEVSATYNPETKVFSYTLYWTSLGGNLVTDIIFYSGAAGTNGTEITRLNGFPTAPTGRIEGTILIPDDLEEDLLAGNLYVNICTDYYLAGEARSQFTRE